VPVNLPPQVEQTLSGLEAEQNPVLNPEAGQSNELPKSDENPEALKIETNDNVTTEEGQVAPAIEDNKISDLSTIETEASVPSIINSNITPNLDPIPIPEVPGEVKDEVANVVEVKPETVVENTQEPAMDTLATPVKATIVEDEPVSDVTILQSEPEAPATETPAAPVTDEQKKVNAVNQLQNIGIDLNDALQHPPQS
jgi:hypothetical protein